MAKDKVKAPQGYTSRKKASGLTFQAELYRTSQFGTPELINEGVSITVERGVKFVPEEMLAQHKEAYPKYFKWATKGYVSKGELKLLTAKDLHELLQDKVKDVTNGVCYWEDRVRPAAERHLESVIEAKQAVIDEKEDTIASLRAVLGKNKIEIPADVKV